MTATLSTPQPRTHRGFAHDGFLYPDDLSYQEGVVEFVREGLEYGEPVLVAVPGPNLELVRQGLGSDAARVRLMDMQVAGRNPGRILGSVLVAFAAEHRGQRVRIVGEPVWPGRSAEEYVACAEHDALVNLAFKGAPVHLLCPYDASRLTPAVLNDAARTHPELTDGERHWPSTGYLDPMIAARAFDRALPEPPEEAEAIVLSEETGPKSARRFAQRVAERAGMTPERITDLRRIVQELAVNTAVHSGGRGLLLAWSTHDQVRIEIRDGGRIADPLAGRRPPAPEDAEHGLWLVNRLADFVRIHHHREGTDIRVHMALH